MLFYFQMKHKNMKIRPQEDLRLSTVLIRGTHRDCEVYLTWPLNQTIYKNMNENFHEPGNFLIC